MQEIRTLPERAITGSSSVIFLGTRRDQASVVADKCSLSTRYTSSDDRCPRHGIGRKVGFLATQAELDSLQRALVEKHSELYSNAAFYFHMLAGRYPSRSSWNSD